MENTLENKARFMAQYWGQKVFKFRDGQMEPQKVGSTYMTKYGIKNRYLLLKPLSSITDEDALELAKIGLPDRLYDYLWSKQTGEAIAKSIKHGRQTNIFYKDFRMADAFDFLKLKGYAVSWMGLSVEKLIEYGWVKLNL